MTTTCSFSFPTNPAVSPVPPDPVVPPVSVVAADAVLFCEVRTVDRFDTDSLTMMSFESTFNSSFNDDIDQWAKLIINNHVVNWDKYIGLEVICYPSVEGDFDLELDDDDDDCCWAVPVPIANGAELDGEERSRVCSDLVLPPADQGQDTSPSVMSCTSCTSPMSWMPATSMSCTLASPSPLLNPAPVVAVAVAVAPNPSSVSIPVVSRVNNGFVRRATYLSLATTLLCMPVETASFFMTLPDGRSVRRSARLNPENAPDSFELTRLQDGRVVRRSTRIAQRLRRSGGA